MRPFQEIDNYQFGELENWIFEIENCDVFADDGFFERTKLTYIEGDPQPEEIPHLKNPG